MSEILSADSAHLVAATCKSYDFTDSRGKRLAGESTTLWLVTDFGQPPIPVKVRQADRAAFDTIAGLGFGALLDVTYSVGADNNRLTRTLVTAQASAAPKRSAA